MKKRFIMLFAVMTMLLCLPIIARAEIVEQGSCGTNVTYTLDDAGTLTISGEGEMSNLSYASAAPWYSNRSKIINVIVENGITHLGSFTFCGCENLVSATLPETVTSFGYATFSNCTNMESINIPDGVTSITASAFEKCHSLASIVIPENVTNIGDYAFYFCDKLASIKIPDSVTDIGIAAFSNCRTMTELTFGSGVTTIGKSAFGNCFELKTVTVNYNMPNHSDYSKTDKSPFYSISIDTVNIGDKVETIPAYLFYDCGSITNINMGKNVTSVGDYAFPGNGDNTFVFYQGDIGEWRNIEIGNHNTALTSASIVYGDMYKTEKGYFSYRDGVITSYSGSDTSLVIPDEIEGEKITAIGAYAFEGCSKITSITIPDSVTSIGMSAFSGCSSLNSVTIPDGVTNIAAFTFSGCSKLDNVTISDNIINIGESSFLGCSSLKTITIPDNVESLGTSAFANCNNLISVNIGHGITSLDGTEFSNCSSLSNIYYKGTIEEYEAVTQNVSSSEFLSIKVHCTDITKGKCGDNLAYYLDNNGTLTVRGIGKMTDYRYPSYAPWYGNKSDIKNVVITDGVTSVGYYAFLNCYSLESVTIGDSVTSIGERAFYSCSTLKSIAIGSGVTSIGDAAFEGCKALEDVYIKDAVKWCTINFAMYRHEIQIEGVSYYYSSNPMYYADNLFLNGEPLTEVNIPEGVTSISSRALYMCKSLKKVTIPDSVTSIGESAFFGCSSLTSIIIPNGVTSICDSTFSGCSSLTSAVIGSGVTSIGKQAFYGCVGLTSITIPENVTYMDDEAFAVCGIRTVNYNAINCTVPSRSGYLYSPFKNAGIENLVIGDKVERIPSYLMYYCTRLKSVTIGKSLKSVGSNVFDQCKDLESVYIPDLESYLNVTFSTNPMKYAKKLYINNKRISGDIVIPNSVEVIPSYAFHGCDGITSVTIPNSVKVIGTSAFGGCSVLKKIFITDAGHWCSILFADYESNPLYYGAELYMDGKQVTELVIPEGVTDIQPKAFYNATNLTKITIPNSVVNIGAEAFYNCKNIDSITIPDSVESIGIYAFRSCIGVTSITIGSGVTNMDSSAFTGCQGLKTLNYNAQKVFDAFKKRTNLRLVVLGDNVTNIDTNAFTDCQSLTGIVIPESVTEIEGGAFKNCSLLTTVHYGGSEAEWNEIYIGADNDYLRNASIKYNCTDIPDISDIVTPKPDPTPVPYTPLKCNVDYKVEGENITFTVEVKDIARADELKSVQLYTAEFDENGRFTGLTTAKNSAVQDGKITITSHVPQADTYKFFLWDGHFAPLMNVLDNESITTQ